MSRVCPFSFLALVWPFAIFLLGRWLEIYPSTSKQFCGCDPSGLDSEPSTDCWAFTWFCMTTSLQAAIHCSLDAIFQQFFSRVVDFMFLQVVLQVCREFQHLSEFQVLHDWFSSLVNSRTVRKIQTLKFLPQWFSMLKASLTIQQTPGMLQFGVSTGPSASAGPLVGLPRLGTGLTFTQRTVSICGRAQGNFGHCGHCEVEFSLHCWVTLQLPFPFVCSITMSWRNRLRGL